MTGRPRSKVRSATSRVKDFSGRWTAPGRCSSSYSSAGRTSTSWAPAATRRCTSPRTTGLGATGSALRPVLAGHGAPGPAVVMPAPTLNGTGRPQHSARPRAARPTISPPRGEPSAGIGEHRSELLDGGGGLDPGRAGVDPTRQTDWAGWTGERIAAVDQDGGRAPKAGSFGLLGRGHQLV